MTSPPCQPRKADVLGTGITLAAPAEIFQLLDKVRTDRALTINVCNVHSVMSARTDRELAQALAGGDVNVPDGRPLVWFLNSLGTHDVHQLRGTDLLLAAVERGLALGWRHYFYGSTDQTLERLVTELRARFPEVLIAGTMAPPFRALTSEEQKGVVQRISEANPHIVWVGLGMPKQEKWMATVREYLPSTTLIGVGAAFDFVACTKREAPRWMQHVGLEWAFRLGSEPSRMWRRYALNNPVFLALWLLRLLRARVVG